MPKKELTPEEALKGARAFSEKYVERGKYRFFPEPHVVEVVQQGLADNHVKYEYRLKGVIVVLPHPRRRRSL